LHGGSPREILFRIAEGDPLELGPRIEELFDEEGLLLESARVHLRTLAAAAYAACADGPPQHLGPWLRERISESVSGLLAEDREAERSGDPTPTSGDPFLPMTAAFGIEHGLARRASVAFHSLAPLQRRLVRRIVHDGKPLADIARELGYPLGETKAELRAAVESLERAIGTRLADRLGGGDRG
jgi:DNA-directed RNA polymerase specialized sigma24 family protein